MLKWRCIQADWERHLYMFIHGCTCLKSMTITHKYTTNDTDVGLEEDTRKHKDTASIQTAPTLSSEATKGLDAKNLSFHNNCPYRDRQRVSSRESLFVCEWEGGGSYNIYPHWEGPDFTSMLILLYVTEPVHLAQSSLHLNIVTSLLDAPGWNLEILYYSLIMAAWWLRSLYCCLTAKRLVLRLAECSPSAWMGFLLVK